MTAAAATKAANLPMTKSIATPAWLDRQAYPFAAHHIDLRAGRMHYIDEGRGEVILLVHGTPTWSFEFRHVVRALAGSYRCVAPDHLGFGLSSRPSGFPYTPEFHAENLSELVDALDLRAVTLVVHDFGGPIALPLALRTPSRLARLAVINSWMWPLDDDPTMQRARLAGGWFGRMLYRHLDLSLRVLMPRAYGNPDLLTPQIHAQYRAPFADPKARADVLWPLARALFSSRDHYARLLDATGALRGIPAAVIWGMRDSAFLPHHLERWRSILPHATVETIAEAGHWPHEEAPREVVEALRALMTRHA